MNFNDYQVFAAKTAVYPPDAKIIYPALGLAGEAGEVAAKIAMEWPIGSLPSLMLAAHAGKAANQAKKILRDDEGELTPERRAAIGKEIGGVLWYCADLATCLGLNLGDIARENVDILASRAKRGTLKGDGDDR